MGLHCLDFLSDSPKNFIFQNKSNKTHFGGLLSLIFFILSILITILYLIDFASQDDFSIEYAYHENILSHDGKEELKNDARYNPYFDFIFDLFRRTNDEFEEYFNLSENYIFANQTNGQLIPRNTILNLRISDLAQVYVLYNCYNIPYNSCKIPESESNYKFTFYTEYNGFILDHQNEKSPLYIGQALTFYSPIYFDNPTIITNNFKIIKYKNETKFSKLINKLKNIDNDESKIIGLTGKSKEIDYFRNRFYRAEYFGNKVNGSEYRTMGFVSFKIDFNHYEEYSRTQKNIWDTISNICSLIMTIFRIFSFFITTFYANNFDNYEIMEKIIKNSIKNQI